MTSATERLPRLLALVPYLVSRPGIAVADAAADFGISEQQLRKDLELLWMCGLPGYGPGDLIDLSFDSDSVTVTYDAGMRRPLRLTATEATSLLVALRALADTPGIPDPDALRRALAKVEQAVGQASVQSQSADVVVGLAGDQARVSEDIRSSVQRAVSSARALRMRYYTASRDAITDRTVDPMRVVLVEGNSYLEAWCRHASGVRLFRMDRIDAVDVLDEPAALPAGVESADLSAGLFPPRADQPEAVLELDPEARWVAEYYPVDEAVELAGGRIRVRIRYSDHDWMVRLMLGLGGHARVSSPPELDDDVRERARMALARSRRYLETSEGVR